MKFSRRPIVIEATQWYKNGDHPQDRFSPEGVIPADHEGRVVRYYRLPDMLGKTLCNCCGIALEDHGFIDTLEGGHRVCPGDWIITGVSGEKYPCKSDVFNFIYESAEPDAQDLRRLQDR